MSLKPSKQRKSFTFSLPSIAPNKPKLNLKLAPKAKKNLRQISYIPSLQNFFDLKKRSHFQDPYSYAQNFYQFQSKDAKLERKVSDIDFFSEHLKTVHFSQLIIPLTPKSK